MHSSLTAYTWAYNASDYSDPVEPENGPLTEVEQEGLDESGLYNADQIYMLYGSSGRDEVSPVVTIALDNFTKIIGAKRNVIRDDCIKETFELISGEADGQPATTHRWVLLIFDGLSTHDIRD